MSQILSLAFSARFSARNFHTSHTHLHLPTLSAPIPPVSTLTIEREFQQFNNIALAQEVRLACELCLVIDFNYASSKPTASKSDKGRRRRRWEEIELEAQVEVRHLVSLTVSVLPRTRYGPSSWGWLTRDKPNNGPNTLIELASGTGTGGDLFFGQAPIVG